MTDNEYKSKVYTAVVDTTSSEGLCKENIHIKGNGVANTFTFECVKDLQVFHNEDLFFVGNPKSNPYSVLCFSDTENMVVLVKESRCEMTIYTGEGASVTSKIEENVCEDLKERASQIMTGQQGNEGKYILL